MKSKATNQRKALKAILLGHQSARQLERALHGRTREIFCHVGPDYRRNGQVLDPQQWREELEETRRERRENKDFKLIVVNLNVPYTPPHFSDEFLN